MAFKRPQSDFSDRVGTGDIGKSTSYSMSSGYYIAKAATDFLTICETRRGGMPEVRRVDIRSTSAQLLIENMDIA